jgi:hypothetical protein
MNEDTSTERDPSIFFFFLTAVLLVWKENY